MSLSLNTIAVNTTALPLGTLGPGCTATLACTTTSGTVWVGTSSAVTASGANQGVAVIQGQPGLVLSLPVASTPVQLWAIAAGANNLSVAMSSNA